MLRSGVAIEAVVPDRLLGELAKDAMSVWAAAHGLPNASPTRREFVSDRLPRHAGREDFRFLGAFADGRLVGFVYGYVGAPGQWWHDRVAAALDEATRRAWLDADHFEITELAVHPDFQDSGIGTRLHDELLAGLPYGRVVLSALADNERVLRFYRRRGWEVLLDELRFEPGRPPFAILGRRLEPGAQD